MNLTSEPIFIDAMNRFVKKLTNLLVRNYHPERVIIFGSYARGQANKDSDIDLLVVKKTQKTYQKRVSEAYQAIREVHDVPIDILVYTPKEFERYQDGPTFVRTVVREGKTLYEKNKFPVS